MRIAGVVVEDMVGTGVEGPVPLTGLTLLFGRNATGKTMILESLASILDPNAQWIGRRPRLDEPPFAYAHLYLSGDWDGDDWAWLRSVMIRQDAATLDNATDPVLPGSSQYDDVADRSRFLLAAVDSFSRDVPAETASKLLQVLARLTSRMLVSYLPFPAGTVDAVIDTAGLDDDVRAMALEVSGLLGDTPFGQRLADVAASPNRFVTLFGFGSFDEDNFDDLALHPPSTINLSAGTADAEAIVVAAVSAAPSLWVVEDGDWLMREEDGRYITAPQITTGLARLQEILQNRPIPAFVLEQGVPQIHIPTPELWALHGRVLLGLRDPEGKFIDIRQTSAGVARWLNILVVLATDDWLSEQLSPGGAVTWVNGLPVVTRAERGLEGRVLVFDEPELHLHPIAQAQVCDWLLTVAESDTTVLTATHSPQIINAYGPQVTLVGLHRDRGETRMDDLTSSALRLLDEAASVYGADRAAWLQIARGLLLVEGEHDVAVVHHFRGEDLQKLRVEVIPIRGHKNLSGTVISEFFGSMGIPIRVMLDDVRSAAVSGDESISLNSSEEQLVRQLMHQRDRFPHLDVVSYGDPDALCALPMSAVRRAWPGANELTWAEIADTWRGLAQNVGFKPYAMKRLGINSDADTFVRRTLAVVVPGEDPSDAFSKAMGDVIDSLR